MSQQDCSNCAGKGTVVQPVQVWDHQKKEYVQVWRADMCQPCGGTGKI